MPGLDSLHSTPRGFSLIESLIALGILAAAATAISTAISSAIGKSHQSVLHHRAVLAIEEMGSLATLNHAYTGAIALDTDGWQRGDCSNRNTNPVSGKLNTQDWLDEISCVLPETRAEISSSANSLDIRLQWRRDGYSEPREIALEMYL